jgi:hypothetical protein
MRGYWTNLIMHTSAAIYTRKNRISSSTAGKSILDVFAVIFMEVFLAVISFPLYIVSRGEITEGKSQFKIRRIFTTTFLIVVLAVWIVKLILIVGLPIYFDSRQYVISSDSQSYEDTSGKNYVLPAFYNASVDMLMPAPVIEKLSVVNGEGLVVQGISKASAKTVINIGISEKDNEVAASSIKSFIVDNDKEGNWILETSSNNFKLNPGNYWLQATVYENNTSSKSQPSLTSYFEIRQDSYEKIVSVIDKYLNYFMIAFITLGIFSIIILI